MARQRVHHADLSGTGRMLTRNSSRIKLSKTTRAFQSGFASYPHRACNGRAGAYEGFHFMAVYEFDPLTDSRWTRFLDQHHGATAFHSPGWLAAIQKTYGYEPIVFTTSGADLTNAMVFCRISSWMTGRRLVSLPSSHPTADPAEHH